MEHSIFTTLSKTAAGTQLGILLPKVKRLIASNILAEVKVKDSRYTRITIKSVIKLLAAELQSVDSRQKVLRRQLNELHSRYEEAVCMISGDDAISEHAASRLLKRIETIGV